MKRFNQSVSRDLLRDKRIKAEEVQRIKEERKQALDSIQQQFCDSNITRLLQSTVLFEPVSDLNASTEYCNGRLAYLSKNLRTVFKYADDDVSYPSVVDLFTQDERALKHPKGSYACSIFNGKTTDDIHFLKTANFFISPSYIQLIRVDHDNWTIEIIDSARIRKELEHIDIDVLNQRRFVLYSEERFQIGQVKDNKLKLEKSTSYSIGRIRCSKLENSKLVSFQHRKIDSVWKWLFVELDLATCTEKLTETQERCDEHPIEHSDAFCWHGSRLYVTNLYGNKTRIFVFNENAKVWCDINIVLKNTLAQKMFVDGDGLLTLYSHSSNFKAFNGIYRFPLRKPDKLHNIILLTVKNLSRFYGKSKMLNYCQKSNIIQSVVSTDDND